MQRSLIDTSSWGEIQKNTPLVSEISLNHTCERILQMVKQQTSCMTDNQSAPVKMQVYKVLSVMTSSERDEDMSATEILVPSGKIIQKQAYKY